MTSTAPAFPLGVLADLRDNWYCRLLHCQALRKRREGKELAAALSLPEPELSSLDELPAGSARGVWDVVAGLRPQSR